MSKTTGLFCIWVITIVLAGCNDGGSADAERNVDSSAQVPVNVDTVSMPTPDTAVIHPETGDPSSKKFKRMTMKAESDSVSGVRK